MISLSDITKDGVSAFIPGGSGSTAAGNAVVNFGAFPGTGEATVAITGQAGITANSVVYATIRPVATSDHSADEHIRESLRIVPALIVPGVGFTIYALVETHLQQEGVRSYGQWNVSWIWI